MRLSGTARKYEYANLAFGPLDQLRVALDYLEDVGLARIEAHTFALASELREGVAKLGLAVLTPPGNLSPIVSFLHGREPEALASALERENVVISFRERGTQVRAAVAMFNNRGDVERLLGVLQELA